MLQRLFAVIVLAAVAACAPLPVQQPPSPPEPLGRLSGEARHPGRVAVPPGATLRVRLLDARPGPDARVLGEFVRRDPGRFPHAFEIDYDPKALGPDARALLEATVHDADDRIRWRTSEAVPLSLPAGAPVLLSLLSVTDLPPLNEVATQERRQAYQCGDLRVEARLEPDLALLLILPDADLRLAPAASASGARFVGRGNTFWTKGMDRAMLARAGQAEVECVAVRERSPWAEARQRGVRFRAVGHEPGWHVEVDGGATPTVRIAMLQGSVTVEDAEPLVGGEGYRGRVGGPALFMRIHPAPCTDIATGLVFPSTAVLQFQGRSLQGCGRHLTD